MSVAERKEKEKKKRSKDIVDGAERLFFSRGYGNVSMDDIAGELELARSTLYLYFRNKEEIYTHIAIRGGELLHRMFDDCSAIGSTGLEKTKLMLLAYIDFSHAYPGYHTAYCSAGVTHSSSSPDEFIRIHSLNIRMLIDAVTEGIHDGSLRKTIDPVKASFTLLSSLSNILSLPSAMAMNLQDVSIAREELIDYSVSMLIHSIKK